MAAFSNSIGPNSSSSYSFQLHEFELGKECEERGDTANALLHYEKAALAGNAEANYKCGFLLKAKGDAEHLSQAIEFFKKAAESKHPKALFELGTLLTQDLHAEGQYIEGKNYLIKAREMGHTEATALLDELEKKEKAAEKHLKIVTLINQFAPSTILTASLIPSSDVYRRFDVLAKQISAEGMKNIKKLEISPLLTNAAKKEKLFNTLLSIGERLGSISATSSPKLKDIIVKEKKSFDFIHSAGGKIFIKHDTHLGQGAVKQVYEGLDLERAKSVAWISVTNEEPEEIDEEEVEENIADAQREKKMLETIHANLEPSQLVNIIPLYKVAVKGTTTENEDELILVQDKLENGSHLIGPKGNIHSKIQLLKGIVNGLKSIHEYDIAHMDIKPANFLFEVSEDDSIVGKLADFGAAVDLEDDDIDNKKVRTLTDAYAAPGLSVGTSIPQTSDDSYSMGVSLFEFITGRNYAVKDAKARMFNKLADTEVAAEIDREMRLINFSNEKYLSEKTRLETLITEEKAKAKPNPEKLRVLNHQSEMMTYYQSLPPKDKAAAGEILTLCKSLILTKRSQRLSIEGLWTKLGEIESRHYPKKETAQPPTS